MEEAYDKFKFLDTPKDVVEKTGRILDFLDWNKELKTFTGRDYYLENIATTFEEFKALNIKLLNHENKELARDWFFFRDVLTGTTRNLLKVYTPTTNANTTYAQKYIV